MDSWDSTNSPVAIELETEVEGEHEGTTDFFFEKIGEGVPLKPHDSNFGPEPPPSQPLAVSERFRAIFIAYSSGFFVARTKDVIDSAKEIKEKGSGISIQQLSLVDVSIGNIHILAISTENSTLAASVAGDMHFFSVTSLLNKEVKKMFYCSLPESGYVKDMQWNTKSEDLFVVLSDSGKLYRGEVDTTLGEVMDNVDAVEWSVQGKLIAVARKNVLGFFSTKFKQKSSVLLSFKSWTDGSEEKCSVRVDSIKWVRPDCIVLGCFKLTADGTEENYLLQVIRNRTGRITDASPKLVVQSFYDLYSGLIDDIVPFGSGPHLFLTYLEQWQLAITAHRKNTDQHIVLLGWSVGDDKSEAAVIDMERDNWLPRIELQENGDDNVVLGLCIDRVSIYQKVSVQCGVEDRTEVSPHCILLCLTLEGRLIMFHVASIAGTKVPLEVISACTNEEEDTSLEFPLEDPPTFLPELEKQELEQISLGPKLKDLDKKETFPCRDSETSKKNDKQASKFNETLMSEPARTPDHYQISHKKDIPRNWKVESFANLQPMKADVQPIATIAKPNQERDGQKLSASERTNLGLFSSEASPLEQPDFIAKHTSKIEIQKTEELASSPGSFGESPVENGSSGSQTAAPHSWSGGTFSFRQDSNAKPSSSTSPSSWVQGSYENATNSFGATNAYGAGSVFGKPFAGKDKIGTLTTVDVTSRPVQSVGQRASLGSGNVESLPSLRSSQMSAQEIITVEKSSVHKFHPFKEHNKTPPMSAMLNTEPKLPKQFGNSNEMTRELDILLESIEEAGGYVDACTISLRSPIEELEQGMEILSEKSKTWRSLVDENLEQIQLSS
ncbi:Nuclear pore complex protein [Quillaja saponaria]|uniref:Nuclear pore complex protein n=1 Tax=Quillaja saponaria TaxID=32244 RepID=A0AAD7PGV0_QUISA|nr:Nuclear pore complex protein [Quillaja saponaria]